MVVLGKRLIDGITSQLDCVVRNGDPVHTYPGCINLSFAFVEGKSIYFNNNNFVFDWGVTLGPGVLS